MKKVSVLIPCKNGEQYLNQVLRAVFKQEHNFELDVVIIDSGSADRTLQIVQSFPVNLKQIMPKDFGHGKTRNLGISFCKGDFIVLLTQDATPANKYWLKNIIKPMLNDKNTAYVYGPHLPRENCNPFEKRNLQAHFNIFLGGKLRKDKLLKSDIADTSEYHVKIYASNCNSALRKSIHEKIPFQDVNMAEDQAWAIDIMKAGFNKVYEPKASVLHSHDYSVKQYFHRFFDEYQSHKEQKNYTEVKSSFMILPRAIALFIRDFAYIAKQSDYNFFKKIYWTFFVLRVNINRMIAAYLGSRYEKLPKWLYEKLSMQKRIIKQ